jgi:hypothetical protein
MSLINNNKEAITKGTALTVAKQLVVKRLKALEERTRAYQRVLLYGEPKVGKSGIAMDCRTEEELKDTELYILDFDNGCEPTWRANWDSDPTIKILNPIFRDTEGYPDLDETILIAEAYISIVKEALNEGKKIKFIFDGADRWKDICFLAVNEDKRSTNTKFLPLLWGKRNKVYDDLMDKVLSLDCDVYVITHMKDVYENINNPNPTGRKADVGRNTFAAINQEIEVSKAMLPNKTTFYAKVKSSKTNPSITGKQYTILTVENGNVTWVSMSELQDGSL